MMQTLLLLLTAIILLACSTTKIASPTVVPTYDTIKSGDSIEYYETDFEARQKNYFELLQGSWVIDTMQRQARVVAEPLQNVTIQFNSDTTFSGQAPCNNIRGAYRLKGTSIKFLNVSGTKMACNNLEQETAFLSLLQQTVSAYSVTQNSLLLRDGASNVVFSARRQ